MNDEQQQQGETETVGMTTEWENFVLGNAPFIPTWKCCPDGDDRVELALVVDKKVHAFVAGFPTHRGVMTAAARAKDGRVYFATNNKTNVVLTAGGVSPETKQIAKAVESPSTLINSLLKEKDMDALSQPQKEMIDTFLIENSIDLHFTPGSDSINSWIKLLKEQWADLPKNLQTLENLRLHYFEAWTELYRGQDIMTKYSEVVKGVKSHAAATTWNRVIRRQNDLPEGWGALVSHLGGTVDEPCVPEVSEDLIEGMSTVQPVRHSTSKGVFTWESFKFILENDIVCVDSDETKGVHAEIKVLEALKSLKVKTYHSGNETFMYKEYSDIPVVEIKRPSCPCCAVYFVHYRGVHPDLVRGHTQVSPCPHLPQKYKDNPDSFFTKE